MMVFACLWIFRYLFFVSSLHQCTNGRLQTVYATDGDGFQFFFSFLVAVSVIRITERWKCAGIHWWWWCAFQLANTQQFLFFMNCEWIRTERPKEEWKKKRTHTARDRQRKRVFKLLASNQVKNSVGTRHAFKILYTFCFYHFPIKKICVYITSLDSIILAEPPFSFSLDVVRSNRTHFTRSSDF